MTVRQTSIVVYREIEANGLLPARRFSVYSWLFHNGPSTAGEVSRGIKYNRNDTASRLAELSEMKVVKEIGERACSTTGYNVILWDVTDQLPQKRNTKTSTQTRKQIIAERNWLFKEVVRLRNILNQHGIDHNDQQKTL